MSASSHMQSKIKCVHSRVKNRQSFTLVSLQQCSAPHSRSSWTKLQHIIKMAPEFDFTRRYIRHGQPPYPHTSPSAFLWAQRSSLSWLCDYLMERSQSVSWEDSTSASRPRPLWSASTRVSLGSTTIRPLCGRCGTYYR